MNYVEKCNSQVGMKMAKIYWLRFDSLNGAGQAGRPRNIFLTKLGANLYHEHKIINLWHGKITS
jgi:hypothetical protein